MCVCYRFYVLTQYLVMRPFYTSSIKKKIQVVSLLSEILLCNYCRQYQCCYLFNFLAANASSSINLPKIQNIGKIKVKKKIYL